MVPSPNGNALMKENDARDFDAMESGESVEPATVESSGRDWAAISQRFREPISEIDDSTADEASKSSTAESGVQSREAIESDDEPPERLYPRSKAFENYKLDPQSYAAAIDCGRRMAESSPRFEWARATTTERMNIADRMHTDLRETLQIEAEPPQPDIDIEHYGETQGASVRYRADLAQDKHPRDMVETLSHEYRHVWQEEVVDGKQEHPVGESERFKLSEASKNYDSDDFEAYAENELELDAERFADTVYMSYLRNQGDRR